MGTHIEENNVILQKHIKLQMDMRKLGNANGKLEFMMWIEWKRSILSYKFWDNRKRQRRVELHHLIDWYEMKHIQMENQSKRRQQERIQSLKLERKCRRREQRHNKHCKQRKNTPRYQY